MSTTLQGSCCYDASLQKGTPDVVVLPAATEEVAAAVRVAHEETIPVIGRDSGTNLSGGTVPMRGAIVNHFGY